MAKIGIVSVGITGRVHASCEIARRLAARGHRLALASTNGGALERMHGADLPFHSLDAGVPAALRDQLRQEPRGAARRALRAAIAEARGRSALEGHGIDGFIAAERPDLLLVESELHDSILYLRSRTVPVVLLEYHLSVRRLPGIPPLDATMLPGAPLAGARAAVAWRRTLLKRRARRRLDRWYFKHWDAHSVWERLARADGAELRDIVVEDQWPMLFYPRLPCIHLCALELDFPGATGDGRDCAGPVIQRSRSVVPDDEDDAACRKWLAERDDSRPLIVCASGSILTLPDFTKKILATATTEARFDLLVAAGRDATPTRLGPLPENVRVFRFVPQLEALARAALFICHGGVSSIHESLLAGVPMLICSAGQMDENGNAARIEYHGLGRRGSMGRDDADTLRGKIESLLGDDSTRTAVGNMRETLRRYESEQRLERLIEARLP